MWQTTAGDAQALRAVDTAARAATLIPRAAASFGRGLVSVVLWLVTVFYLFLQGPALVAFVLRISPLHRPQTSASKGEMVLPRLLLFLTIFGGLQVFGPIGLLLGPLAGSLAVVALQLAAEQRGISLAPAAPGR